MSVPVSATVTLSAKKTGDGATVDFTAPMRHVSMVVAPSGTVTTAIVGLEASRDGTVWVSITSRDVHPTVPFALDSNAGAYRYWRGKILADVAGGGTVSATLMGVA